MYSFMFVCTYVCTAATVQLRMHSIQSHVLVCTQLAPHCSAHVKTKEPVVTIYL